MGPHHSRKKLPPSPLHTTRLHPNQLEPTTLPLRFPTLATGVEVITVGEERLGERIWLGGSAHGVEVTRHLRFFSLDGPELRPALFTALRALDGSRSVAELATSLSIPLNDLSRLLLYLESEALIDFHIARLHSARSQIQTHTHSPSRSQWQWQQTRRHIERAHLPRGTSFKKRSQRTIAIISQEGAHGTSSTDRHAISPIAISVAALLFGSGFDRIRFIKPDHSLGDIKTSSDQISDRDLGLSIFNGTDVGLEKTDRLLELAHRSAILPRDEMSPLVAEDFNAELTISIGYPRADHHQRWLSEDRTFMIVPGFCQGEVRIGPIVIPGRTPCLRCFELNQIENDFWREQSRQLRLLQPSIDPPKIASHLIASMSALYATSWLDAVEDPLEGRVTDPMDHLLLGHQLIHELDAFESSDVSEPRSPVRVERWYNHPECGCLWLPRVSHGKKGLRGASGSGEPSG